MLLFVRRPFVCFFLATLVLALPVFIAALSSQTSDIVDKFRPELVYWLVLFGLLAEVPANFFWMGAAIRFLAEPEE